jgi:hypothetical protein
MAGLLPRLNLVEEERETLSSVQDRVGFAKDNFAVKKRAASVELASLASTSD